MGNHTTHPIQTSQSNTSISSTNIPAMVDRTKVRAKANTISSHRTFGSALVPPPGVSSSSEKSPRGITSFCSFDMSRLSIDKSPTGLIGKGAAGCVRRALLDGTRVVAVKTLSALASDEEFENEVQQLMSFKHPCILEMIGAAAKDELRSIVMEYIASGSLEDLLFPHLRSNEADIKPVALDWELILLASHDLAAALRALHNTGVIHRDVKPGNLLVSSLSREKGIPRLKLADFGTAKNMQKKDRMSAYIGTPVCMAPEVANDFYTVKADIYSFSIVLWHMVTRQEPFTSYTLGSKLTDDVVKGLRPPIPSLCPPRVAELLKECWQPEPARRPNGGLIKRELDALLEESPTYPPLPEVHAEAAKEVTQTAPTSASDKKVEAKNNEVKKELGLILDYLVIQRAEGQQVNDLVDSAMIFKRVLRVKTLPEPKITDVLTAVKKMREILEKTTVVRLSDIRNDIELQTAFVATHLQDSLSEVIRDKTIDVLDVLHYLPCLEAQNMWRDYFGSATLTVATDTFFQGWRAYFSSRAPARAATLPNSPNQFSGSLMMSSSMLSERKELPSAARAALDIDILDALNAILDHARTGTITIHKFGSFLSWAAPLSKCAEKLKNLLESPYFHSYLSYESVKCVMGAEPVGSYLLRFSQSLPGAFAAAIKISDTTIHQVTIKPVQVREEKVVPSGITTIGSEADIRFKVDGHPTLYPSLQAIASAFPDFLKYPVRNPQLPPGALVGMLSFEDTKLMLQDQLSGTYIIRLSANQPGAYVFGYVTPTNTIEQVKVVFDPHSGKFILGGKTYSSIGEVVRLEKVFKQPYSPPQLETLRKLRSIQRSAIHLGTGRMTRTESEISINPHRDPIMSKIFGETISVDDRAAMYGPMPDIYFK